MKLWENIQTGYRRDKETRHVNKRYVTSKTSLLLYFINYDCRKLVATRTFILIFTHLPSEILYREVKPKSKLQTFWWQWKLVILLFSHNCKCYYQQELSGIIDINFYKYVTNIINITNIKKKCYYNKLRPMEKDQDTAPDHSILR